MPKMNGGIVEFKAGKVRGRGYLAVPKASKGGVLVLHAWWGLNDFFKSFCDRLEAEGYTSLAPDLYFGKVAQTVSEAKELMQKSSEELSQNVVSGGLDYLHSHPTVRGRSVGAIGFSMGAGWALSLSNKRPSEVGAVVAFYGTGQEDFSKSQSSYLGHFAPEDEWEQIDYVRSVEEKIRQAGRPVVFHYYPGAKHWFFEDNRSDAYDPQAARLAWTRTLEFLQSTLDKASTK